MITEFVNLILQNFSSYVDDPELYKVAFTVLSICISIIAIASIFSLICTFFRGWYK